MSPSLQKTFIGLIVLAVLFFIFERFIGRVRGPVLRRGWFTDVSYFFLTPFFTLYAIFIHARLNWDFGPLRYVIATPVFHRWHHSR